MLHVLYLFQKTKDSTKAGKEILGASFMGKRKFNGIKSIIKWKSIIINSENKHLIGITIWITILLG